jgi:hypothetical protein
MLDHTLIFSALRSDLVASGALQTDVIVGLIRWFDPNGEDYVLRVTEWQVFLCQGTAENLLCGPLLVRAKVAQAWSNGFALIGEPARVAAVHQIACLFWKEEVAVEPNWTDYVSRVTTSGQPDLDHPIIGKLAEWTHHLLGKAPSWDEVMGMSGSGATADRRNASSRWVFDSRPIGLPSAFYSFNAHDDTHYHSDVIYTARASAVPKNRKSARIVASEPASAMYAQLGLMQEFDKRLERERIRVPLRNADLHRRFLVRHREMATLDLSDASDYISLDLASAILPTDWFDMCNACRSQAVRLPDGTVHRLATYAPMGNGFCFRLLSVVCAGLLAVTCRDKWSDFGDDMICSRHDAPFVSMGLRAAGLRLNELKSCYADYVETCGLELYKGYNVTPLKLKKILTFKGVYCDLMAAQRAAQLGLNEVSKVLCNTEVIPTRYNRNYQRLEYRCPVWVTSKLEVKVDGWAGLLRWQRQRGMNYRTEVATYSRTQPGYRWLASLDEASLLELDFDPRLKDALDLGPRLKDAAALPPAPGEPTTAHTV